MQQEDSKESQKNEDSHRSGINRNPDGTFKEGVSGNPGGRPRNSLKSYVAKKLAEMSDSEKEEFLKTVSSEVIWKMGEGAPAQKVDTDLRVNKPFDELSENFGLQKNKTVEKED